MRLAELRRFERAAEYCQTLSLAWLKEAWCRG